LHADDAVANKVCALFGRALPRDFLNVIAVLLSGRYSREQLLELAAEADRGFDRLIFADALGALTQITGVGFAEYRTDPDTIAHLRHRFDRWRHELIAAGLVSRADHLLFASEMLGAVRGTNPAGGFPWDDTRRYVDAASLTDDARSQIFEHNTRRVYPRLDARLKQAGR
jgi:hypothetical protein